MKLWQKNNTSLNRKIEKFTVDKDVSFDQRLAEMDCYASIAHAKMLQKAKIISKNDFKKLKKELLNIIRLNNNNKFKLTVRDEDIHSKIENHLTRKLGDLGKKIHTARSRNDQVLVDTRLYSKKNILEVEEQLLYLCSTLLKFSEKNEFVPMPGYTHTRKAMPSSVGLWASSFIESLLDDLTLLKAAYNLNNQNPLGSAAGYGVSIHINRNLTTELLGFDRLQNNVLYVQNSRGKIESIILSALMQIMIDVGRLANDLIMFSSSEFNFIKLPEEFCTGSSIMPHKWNPDVLELVRGKSSVMQSYLFQVTNIIDSLPSGYNRDLQLTKEPIMEGLELTKLTLEIVSLVISKLKANKSALVKACNIELFATDKTLDLVEQNVPFRDAYKIIAESRFDLNIDPVENIKSKKHQGATGNLGLKKLEERIKAESKKLNKENVLFDKTIKKIERLN